MSFFNVLFNFFNLIGTKYFDTSAFTILLLLNWWSHTHSRMHTHPMSTSDGEVEKFITPSHFFPVGLEGPGCYLLSHFLLGLMERLNSNCKRTE